MAKNEALIDVKTLSVEALEAAPLATLRLWFEAVFGQPPPPKASPWVIRGNLAWALQAAQQGKEVFKLRAQLKKYVEAPSAKVSFKSGTRLIRAWQGKTHEVTVLEEGFRYQGQPYKTLSEIARLITGTRWSGPRFFGLTDKKE
jgi:hypothetical protein